MKTMITLQLNQKLWLRFNELIKQLGLRRDAYLNRVLPSALSRINVHASNSSETGLWVKRRAAVYPSVKATLSLDKKVAARLDETCDKKNLPRDVFFNHFLAALVRGNQGLRESKVVEVEGPLSIAASVMTDPLGYIEEEHRSKYEEAQSRRDLKALLDPDEKEEIELFRNCFPSDSEREFHEDVEIHGL